MLKERTNVALRLINRNDGQLDWLPRNPRQWTQTDIDRTAASIQEDPDFLEDRPLLLVPVGDEYVVFAGNLRREGAKKCKLKTVPAVIYHPDGEDDRLTVKRRAMKDNGSFGAWDFDLLANEWDDLPLTDWGVPAWDNPADANDDGGAPALENPYSTKLEAPVYEIRGEKPAEADLVDTTKVDALLAEIDAAEIPDDVRNVLRVCAYRHAVIDFELMAEYYAHAPKNVQELMENNALVIIDFDRAIANGFVKMTADLQAIYDKNTAAYGTE